MPHRRGDHSWNFIAVAVYVPLVLLASGCGGSGTTRVLYVEDVYGTEEDDTADEVYIDDAVGYPDSPQEEPWPAEEAEPDEPDWPQEDPWADEGDWDDYEDDFDDLDDWEFF